MRIFVFISIGLATFGLAAGYIGHDVGLGAAIISALGLLWLASQWRGWHRLNTLIIMFFMGAIIYGGWQGVSAWWLLLSIVTILVAWDMEHFTRRLQHAGHVEAAADIQRVHLQRLMLVAGTGLLLGSVALSFRFTFSLGWAILLGALAVIGLSRVISLLRQESD